MQLQDRVKNAQQQAHELGELYGQLDRRITTFNELQGSLVQLREQLHSLASEVAEVQATINTIQQTLPGVARKEELEQLSKRVDAMPFEQFATKRDLNG